ncbi:cardiolipin synthase [Paenibacillus sp. FJAT-26967]|uniref:cardiolipin synthase n=1 Tax=Paenibacillus sp. FJAT-26967 TaxID=1729690 RepID=UPI0008394CCC|nr:cardiolipin synthase [Paenibacillus sp. FJAT-26967]
MLWLVIVLILFIFQTVTIVVVEFRNSSKTVAWLMILFIFPVIGFIMYYFLAKEYSQRRNVKRKTRRVLGEMQREMRRELEKTKKGQDYPVPNIINEPRLFGLLSNIPSSPITRNNEVEVLTDGKATYEAMFEAMEQAKHHIHFEFYILRDDETGKKFQELLVRKAREGVEVRVIYDGIGSYKLSAKYIRELTEAGIETYCFLPAFIAFFDKRMNYRNHRKIIVVDGLVGFLGGINIGDEYLGMHPVLGYWRDTHLKITGDAVYYLQSTFLSDWEFVSRQKLSETLFYPEHTCEGNQPVQVVASGPDAHWDSILESYFGGITTAKKRIYITTPYFIPDQSLIMGLKTAAISGVDVKIILPEIPDSWIVHYASLSYLQDLMQTGVRFYQYQPGFVHAKVTIIDNLFATVGTANMDMRSFYSNFELNAILFDQKSIERLEHDFINDLKNSKKLSLSEFEKRSRFQKGKEVMGRLLSPLF